MVQTENISFIDTLLPLACIVFFIAIGVIVLYQHFRKNLYKQMLEQEELKGRHQNDLLRSSIEVQENERKRIAQNMHDELGATLSIARMHLLQLERQPVNDKGDISVGLQQVRSLTETSLATMRRISHELMPPQLEKFGLINTLEDVATQLKPINGIELRVAAGANMPVLSWTITLGMYRIIMELINNTLKHANASSICITLNFERDYFTVAYSDNGIGLSQDSFCKGSGWNNIEARINSLGGHSGTNNNGATGFNMFIEIPVYT